MFTPEKEKEILAFWEKERVFEKSVEARKGKKPFVFYEGPPTANGKPGIHHVLARSFKDIILRYKTMQGFFTPRRAGWDTHGLPVELEVEKKLGINSKEEIERYGIAEFVNKAKESVWQYKSEWETLTRRMGFWIDLDDPYITYDTSYIETLWYIIKQWYEKGLFVEDFKVVPWCYRCGTPLSSHELAQGYKVTKDLAVFVKFKVQSSKFKVTSKNLKVFILSWTTTPWTLPGNVALAVGEDIDYVEVKVFDQQKHEYFNVIIAKQIFESIYDRKVTDPLRVAFDLSYADDKYEGEMAAKGPDIVREFKGKDLVGLEYKSLFDVAQLKGEKSYKVYAADFVNTDEGTGVVHTSVMYGEDDFKLGEVVGLPKFHTVSEKGTFIDSLGEGLGGMPVKAKETEEKIIGYLKEKNLLLGAEQYEHEYPHCWRCKNPLLYYATRSWFVKTTAVKKMLIANNGKINWIPKHLKDGRFGNFLEEVKDWAFSRQRYWGTPLPIWRCQACPFVSVIGSLEELGQRALGNANRFFLARHTEAEHTIKGIVTCDPVQYDLTPEGEKQAKGLARRLKKEKIDIIIASPLARTMRTARIIAKETGAEVIADERLRELDFGPFEGKSRKEYDAYWESKQGRFTKTPCKGMENFHDIRTRLLEAMRDIDRRYHDKRIALVSHQGCLWVLEGALRGLTDRGIAHEFPDDFTMGEIRALSVSGLPYNNENEIDLHRPFIDNVQLCCKNCKNSMRRVQDVADVWFDSGAMPFAQGHWPFAQTKNLKLKTENLQLNFPADYIVEAIDQTRGWFYTLLVTSTLLGFQNPYKNVISLGHLLDEQGRKMSKSLGNIIDPFEAMEKYGADAIRWYFFVVNPPGLSKRLDPKEILSHQRGFFMTLGNSVQFLLLYAGNAKPSKIRSSAKPRAILDRWMLSRVHQTIETVTILLDAYDITQASRLLEELVEDISHWYIRRSRQRMQGKEAKEVCAVLSFTFSTLASLLAPFAPFSAEIIHNSLLSLRSVKATQTSVHCNDWPKSKKALVDKTLMDAMEETRRIVALALAKRAIYGIKVRQPLASLTIKAKSGQFFDELQKLMREEVNVKAIRFDQHIADEVELDMILTDTLKNEGMVRDVIRHIQDLRKQGGLKPGDRITLFVSDASFFDTRLALYKEEIMSKVGANHIETKAPLALSPIKKLNFEGKEVIIGVVPV